MEAYSNSKRYQEIKSIPNDQYLCTKCNSIPEIISIDYNKGIIEFECKNHDIQKVNMREYFEQESKYLYYNIRCDDDKTRIQKDDLSYIFNRFIDSGKFLCENCSKGKTSKCIKINETKNTCPIHIKKYIKFCKECNIHFCSEDNIKCGHTIEEIKIPKNKDINIIKMKIDMLNYQIKFLNTLLTTYEKHPSNYYNSINITNVAKDLLSKGDPKFYSEAKTNAEIFNKNDSNNNEFITIIYNIPLDSSDIKLFGEKFVEKYKGKCKIIINDTETELCTNYSLKNSEKNLKVKLKLNTFITDMSLMFEGCSSLSSLEVISQPQTENVSNMHGMFSGCSSLSSLEGISKWKTDNVTDMSYMFHECSSLESLAGISNWQTGNVSNMSYMFYECTTLTSLEGISKWQTGKVTNMNGMFGGCSSLSNLDGISNFYTGNVTDMSYMFHECSSLSSLTGISNWQTGKVTDMSYMFYDCSSLLSLAAISNWQTGKVTNMNGMFSGCSSLSNLNGISNFYTGNVTDMSYMFKGCFSLSSLDGISKWKTEKVTKMNGMFRECSTLSSVDRISEWKIGKATDVKDMFFGCSKLSNIPQKYLKGK